MISMGFSLVEIKKRQCNISSELVNQIGADKCQHNCTISVLYHTWPRTVICSGLHKLLAITIEGLY